MTTMTQHATGSRAYRAGVGVAIATSFLTVWTTIVRDDGSGEGFFMVILAAAVAAVAAGLRAGGMARAMAGVAVMQVLLAGLVATEPVMANYSNGALKVVLHSTALTALWLVSAAFFRAAAKGGR